jgi:uncharacterized Zn finger protein (UPF0148 family)
MGMWKMESMVCQDCGGTFYGGREDYCPVCDSSDVETEADMQEEQDLLELTDEDIIEYQYTNDSYRFWNGANPYSD